MTNLKEAEIKKKSGSKIMLIWKSAMRVAGFFLVFLQTKPLKRVLYPLIGYILWFSKNYDDPLIP